MRRELTFVLGRSAIWQRPFARLSPLHGGSHDLTTRHSGRRACGLRRGSLIAECPNGRAGSAGHPLTITPRPPITPGLAGTLIISATTLRR